MALAAQFERGLQKLLERRTAWLRSAIGKKRPGRRPTFKKDNVEPQIEDLGDLAAQIITKMRGKKEFRRLIEEKKQWHPKRGKGWGVDAKQKAFRGWYEKHIGGKNCVYVFWTRGTCEYVGRTIHGKGRPVGWFTVFWFRGVTRLDILTIRTKSEVRKAECLAMHIFDPRQNKNWPSRKKYTKKCPVCVATRNIDDALESIFRFR